MRSFFVMYCGQLVSAFGSGLTRFALGIWVFSQTGIVTTYTTLLFCATVSLSLGSLAAGPISDRYNRRHVLLAGNTAASLTTLIVAVLHFADALTVWHLAIALTINGFATAFILTAFEACIPQLVPHHQLGRAAGLNQLMQASQSILAPVLAAALLETVGLGGIFLIDFVTFTFCLLTLLSVRLFHQPAAASSLAALWDDFRAGVRYLSGSAPFRALLVFAVSAMMLFAGVIYALATPLILSFADARGLSWAIAAFGVGALGAALLLSIWGGPARRMPAMLLAITAAALATLVCGVTTDLPVITGAFAVIGFGFMTMFGLNRALWQTKAPRPLLGRLLSLRLVCTSLAQSAGMLAAGPLVDAIFEPLLRSGGALAATAGRLTGTGSGRSNALAYLAVGALALILVGISVLRPEIRNLEDDLPDAALPDRMMKEPQ